MNKVLLIIVVLFVTKVYGDENNSPGSYEVQMDKKGISIRTNTTSMPFYLIPKNQMSSAMVGKKLDTNIVDAKRICVVTQYSPSAEMINGRVAHVGYYIMSGRFGVIEGNVLTLNSFEITQAADGAHKGEVVEFRMNSWSHMVDTNTLARINNIKSSAEGGGHAKPKTPRGQ
jgi:hypothetical protein